MEQMTFDELLQDVGSTLYANMGDITSDTACQKLIEDWFWDCKLCAEKDKFIRYFRTRLSNIYPLYKEELRVLTIKENMDPFVTDYYQHISNDTTHEAGSANKLSTDEGTNSSVFSNHENSETIRTPDLTTTSDSNGSTNGSSTENKNGSDTLQRSGTDTTTNTENQTGGSTNNKSANGSSRNENISTSKSDSIGIQYPESNLVSLSLNIDDIPDNRSLAYASNESIGQNKGTSVDTATNNQIEVDTQTTHNNSTGSSQQQHNTTDTQNYGSEVNIENQTESEESGTVHQEGNETTTNVMFGGNTTNYQNNSTSSENSNDERNSETEHKEEHKGRSGKSVAELIPIVISAIRKSNTGIWFRDYMSVCFDCTEF